MKRAARIITLLVLAAWLPSCNTTKGVGTDVGAAGDALKHSAERNGAK